MYKFYNLTVKEGSNLRTTCEAFNIPFACQSGFCGICQINILEGEDNLSPLSDSEKELGMDKSKRLACQCNILKGSVKIDT